MRYVVSAASGLGRLAVGVSCPVTNMPRRWMATMKSLLVPQLHGSANGAVRPASGLGGTPLGVHSRAGSKLAAGDPGSDVKGYAAIGQILIPVAGCITLHNHHGTDP